MKNSGLSGDIEFGSYGPPESALNSYSTDYLLKSEYVNMAQRTHSWMDSNGKVPNYIGVYIAGSPDFGPDYLLLVFTLVILDFNNSSLVSTVSW